MAFMKMVSAEGLSYVIETAGTITEALKLLEENSYDIVLIDYMLPDGTGIDLLHGISRIPVIFVTGSGDTAVAVRAMKEGAYDYLIKDADRVYLKLLRATIDKVMHTFMLEMEHEKDAQRLRMMNAELSRIYEEAKELSLHDPLTGLANRRLMDIVLERNIAMAKRGTNTLSVLMLDIDYFKKYNDTHGHQAGDRLLVSLGKVLTEEIRGADLVARYGGEEFLLLLPDTDMEGAFNLAERIRNMVFGSMGITVSLGAAVYRVSENVSELVERVDRALYRAKEDGRNRIEKG